MRRRPRLLDLFCGAGGAAMGYYRAGFDVLGVDNNGSLARHYPFEFVKGDALTYLRRHGTSFDVIHASPPCKLNTRLKAFSAAHHKELIPTTRRALCKTGLPYVIENVEGAALIEPGTLCGSSFDLGVRRHRLFESNISGLPYPACDHERQAQLSPGYPVLRYHSGKPIAMMSPVIGVYGRGQGLGLGESELWKQAMGIDWMTKDEMAQAIPPDYTEWLGSALLDRLGRTRRVRGSS